MKIKNDPTQEMQQVQLTLEGGKTLVYFGPAQVFTGDKLKVVDLQFTNPMSMKDIMALDPDVDNEEE
tara:strand:- start:328 stop:528 length:201 start_codon:yes stop_codon:yes gene_type:complete